MKNKILAILGAVCVASLWAPRGIQAYPVKVVSTGFAPRTAGVPAVAFNGLGQVGNKLTVSAGPAVKLESPAVSVSQAGMVPMLQAGMVPVLQGAPAVKADENSGDGSLKALSPSVEAVAKGDITAAHGVQNAIYDGAGRSAEPVQAAAAPSVQAAPATYEIERYANGGHAQLLYESIRTPGKEVKPGIFVKTIQDPDPRSRFIVTAVKVIPPDQGGVADIVSQPLYFASFRFNPDEESTWGQYGEYHFRMVYEQARSMEKEIRLIPDGPGLWPNYILEIKDGSNYFMKVVSRPTGDTLDFIAPMSTLAKPGTPKVENKVDVTVNAPPTFWSDVKDVLRNFP